MAIYFMEHILGIVFIQHNVLSDVLCYLIWSTVNSPIKKPENCENYHLKCSIWIYFKMFFCDVKLNIQHHYSDDPSEIIIITA